MGAMTDAPEITADDIRNSLIARAEDFAERKGMALSRMSDDALKDSKFLANVKAGKNFTLRTYQRMIDWMDEAEATIPDKTPKPTPSKEGAAA